MAADGTRCRGVYGTYRVAGTGVAFVSRDEVDADDLEDADDPGKVGDRSGCAVSDSRELVRGSEAPCALPIDDGGNNVSRFPEDMSYGPLDNIKSA